MNEAIEQIKKRIDIVELLSSFITLKKTGRNFKANCPFHQEKTPSFVVSPERQIWHCFGSCGEGGDIIKFLMKWENITFVEAVKELADKANVKIANVSFEDKQWSQKERLLTINNLAAEYFSHILFKTDLGKKTLEYLSNRGIREATAKHFMLGYAPQSWDSLLKFLKKKKFSENEMLDAGLLVKSERGSYYDRFRGRLVFPIKDPRGSIIGFSARTMDEKEKASKYINTPETLLYHKRETLYGMELAKEAIKKEHNVYLVEGEFDVISSSQAGLENVAATKGTAVTFEQMRLLKRFTNRITLMLDADTAGEEAVRRAIEEGEKLDLEVAVTMIDFAKDPDEAVRTDATRFKQLVKKPIPAYDFVFSLTQKKHAEGDSFSKKNIAEDMIPFIERIQNPIIQSHYIKNLADFLDVSEGSVEMMIRKLRQKKKQKTFQMPAKTPKVEERGLNIQKYLLSIIFQSKDSYQTAERIFDILIPADFTVPAYEKITGQFLEFKKESEQFDLKKFITGLAPQLRPVLDELYLFASLELEFKDDDIRKLALEIKKNSLKAQISGLMTRTELSEEENNSLRKLADALKEVEKTASSL